MWKRPIPKIGCFWDIIRPYWRELRPLVTPWAWCIKEGTDPWKGQKRALLSHVQVSCLPLSLSSPSLALLCFYDALLLLLLFLTVSICL